MTFSGILLAVFFACFLVFVSIQMFLNKKPKPSRSIPGFMGLFSAGTGIGGFSALVSIGGGTLTVPYLTWHNVDVKQAIGTSAAIGLPISLAGTVGYLINGWSVDINGWLIFGFVNLPAVVLISALSFTTAPLGAKLAHSLPVPVLKKGFAVLLLVLAARMLMSVT